jgi:two-component system, LytTR family, response regulator
MNANIQQHSVLVVDDEAPARRLLLEYLAQHSEYRLVAEARNGREAVELALAHKPNLILLDVDMPGLDGFEVLPFLPPETAVVFVTAHDEFALRAFEVHAVDYLLKPVSFERFGEALRRAALRLAGGHASPPEALRRDVRPSHQPLERIVIRDGARIDVVRASEVEYIEAQDDYVEVYFKGRSRLAPETLAGLEAALDSTKFVRVHRSFIVHLKFLDGVKTVAPGKKVAVVSGGREIPISRAGDARLRTMLGP